MRRFRRLRATDELRRLVCETRLSKKELIYPIFVAEGENIKSPVDSMPNVYQYSLDRVDEILAEISASGISGLLIFGIPAHKDELATEAYNDNGITQRAVRLIKEKYPKLIVIAELFTVTRYAMTKRCPCWQKWLSASRKQARTLLLPPT